VIYRIGRAATNPTLCGGTPGGMSCTVYGDAGWNEVQDGQSGRAVASLWPFPNEGTIKSLVCSYSPSFSTTFTLNPTRGFCSYSGKDGSHNTLTSYIWEYLG